MDLEGARLNEAWKSFKTWTQPVLAFATSPQTIPAGTPSAAMSLALVTSSGLAVTTPTTLAVTLTSSSATGTFATSSAGPWTSTLSLTIVAGTRTTAAFYYQDTRAGSHTLTASAEGATNGTQVITVTPGPLTAVAITPRSMIVRARASQALAAAGRDSFGNVVPVAASWSLTPHGLGTLATRTGTTTTFTAGRTLGQGTVGIAVAAPTGMLTATAALRVVPARLTIAGITYRASRGGVLISVSARDAAGKFVSRARVSTLVQRNGRRYASARAVTGPAGRVTFRIPTPRAGGCLVTTVRRVTAQGFALGRANAAQPLLHSAGAVERARLHAPSQQNERGRLRAALFLSVS